MSSDAATLTRPAPGGQSAGRAAPGGQPAIGQTVLEARNIAKSYGAVHALKGVNFEVRAGQVTTLFGENGAGKSTLMKVLSGVIRPSSGEILLDGAPVTFASSTEARDRGISIIHQELSLAPNLNVRDNIFMGREIMGSTGVNFAEEARQTAALMAELEQPIDPLTLVEDLRLGQQQIVEIARALSARSRILIMDEPTSALSASEVELLFRVIRDLKARGVAIVYISHHLEEALTITDNAVVLRDGAMTAYAPRSEIDLEWIVRHMVGENFDLGSPPTGYQFGAVALAIDEVSVADASGAELVDRLSLHVRRGEIVCIYGLMGAGRTELLEAVAGRLPLAGGQVRLEGEDVSNLTIAQRIGRGLVLVPEDRQRDGLVQTMTVGQNLSLASIPRFVRGLFTSPALEKGVIADAIRQTTVKTAGPDAAMGSLSGGNQQKVVIGKMLATHPRVVLLDEPSRGIDVGAKAEVFRLLAEGARKGLAVIFSTSEVGECLSVAHRIIVMRKGKIAAEFGPEATKKQIMAASGEVNLSQQIAQAGGLEFCEVVSDIHQDELPLRALGEAGAAFLREELARGPEGVGQQGETPRVIGLGYGRTLVAVAEAMAPFKAPGLRLIPLMGTLAQPAGAVAPPASPHQMAGRLAELTGGAARDMPAPLIADSAQAREALLRRPDIAVAFAEAARAELMVVGIGAVDEAASLVSSGLVAPDQVAHLRAQGGVGEVLGHSFDAGGAPVRTPLTQRILTLPLDALRGRRIVAIAGGAPKVEAIRAVLKSGLLAGLITDETTARALADHLRAEGEHPGTGAPAPATP